MESLKDEELMKMFCLGNNHAFDIIYDRYKNRIFSFILNVYEKNQSMAEDSVQEVFIRVIRYKDTFDRSMHFSTWIYTVARNVCLNKIRAKDGLLHFEIIDTDIPDELDSSRSVSCMELDKIIRDAISKLPENQKSVFVMREMDGMSYQEIAGVIGLSEGNIRTLLYRAKKELKKIIEPYIEGKK